MMWFFCFGLVILMTWSLQRFLGALAEALFGFRKKALDDSRKTTLHLVRSQLVLALTDPSPNANRLQAALFQSLRLRTWRANLMWVCFSSFSLWAVFAVGFSFLQLSGLLILALSGIVLLASAHLPLWISDSKRRALKALAAAFFFWGLFTFAGESSMRFAAGLMNLETGSAATILADGTFFGVLILFLVGLAGGFLLRAEYLFFCFALAGLASGVLSVNGAVALWLAERTGLALAQWARGRNLSNSTRALLKESALVQLAGALVGAVMIGFLRDFWGPVAGIGADAVGERLGLFLIFSFLVEVPVVIALAIWGHRRGAKVPEDLFQVSYPKPAWLEATLPRRFVLSVAFQQASMRRLEIQRLREDFAASNWQGVPPAIRSGSEKDLAELEVCLNSMQAHLLSRSSFLDHQLG